MGDRKEFTLEEILEEQRIQRETGSFPAVGASASGAEEAAPEAVEPDKAEKPAAQTPPPKPKKQPRPPKAPRQEPPAPDDASADDSPADVASEDGVEDINQFATGKIEMPEYEQESFEPMEEPSGGKKKKKKKGGLFGRKKKVPEYDETEDDMYYGIQLKPIDEYRKGFDPNTGEFALGEDSFKALFDDSKKAIDDEVEKNFEKLQKERRRRVAEAVQNAGMDEDEVADELGIVAPMPVTAFAADPYARQHGIAVEGVESPKEELPEFQRAMLESSGDKTMEIKLNVLNDTVEIQRVKDMPAVSEETVNKILDSAGEQLAEQEDAGYEVDAGYKVDAGSEGDTGYEVDAESPREPVEEIPGEPYPEEQPKTQVIRMPAPASQNAPASQIAPKPQAAPAAKQAAAGEETGVISGRPLGEIPQIVSIYEYRSRSIPTHVINADVLQSALLSESEEIVRETEEEEAKRAPRRRVKNQKLELPREEEEEVFSGEESQESIDDYTGPEDAKSISHELRSDMRELTLRMLVTGVCTLLLAIVNLIFGSSFSGAAGDLGSMPTVYVVLSVVFLGVSIGICYRTIGNGLKALFSFNANSDSAAAVAAIAVLIQAVTSIFFTSDVTGGKLHLYAVVLSAILFVNAAGKLTMIRRIHSNFRFVTSREQKYAVQTYDDYNTSLKMTKDVVAEKPLIAYQCKTGFLKRFLELSYNPDPAETASQFLAPIGLISSLVLCIATLLITQSVPTALSAFAAASCACVAVTNMLGINLPMSRLCKTARRAGAMVVGYEAVRELGNVNAVMVDAEDIFPRGTVVLNGIKTFGNRAGAEDAIIFASALMNEVGGPLSGVFDQVISEIEDALPEVESFTYEDGHGIVGRVDGKKIYIGNRGLMINHRIEPPAREEETQYASGNQQIIYIAVDTVVSAMLVLTYAADRRRKNELQRMEDSGVSVLIRTTDVNVTPQLISRLFGIDVASVSVLESPMGEVYQKLAKQNIPRADARVATKGRMESMMSVVSACAEEKRSISLIVAIQNIAVVLGFVLVAFLACFGGMKSLSSFVLFVFELFWLLLTVLVPRLRRR